MNPFVTVVHPDHGPLQACSTEDRCRMAATFTRGECERALKIYGLQKAVVAALERRLRALGREAQ